MKKYVVAGNYQEYESHIDEKGYIKSEYVFVYSPDQLRGLGKIEGFYIGSYEQRPDIDQIRQIIAQIKARNKIYKASASQGLPPLHPNTVFPAPSGFTPRHIMVKTPDGGWQSHNLTDGSVTYGPNNDDSTIAFATR